MNTYRIKHIAEAVDREKTTIIRYEKLGLIPLAKKDKYGWRYYSKEDVAIIADKILKSNYFNNMELQHCKNCNQMTNHKDGVCLKCKNMENEIIKNLYQIVDSFLVEAKDQNGNDRSLERLNADRHLAVENLNNLFLSELKALKEECVGEEVLLHINESRGDNIGVEENWGNGYNKKREEMIKAFAKRGV